jgi:hypothetical protein
MNMANIVLPIVEEEVQVGKRRLKQSAFASEPSPIQPKNSSVRS